MGLTLLKAEAAVAVAQALGKTVSATAERTFVDTAKAFASGTAYYGKLRVVKIDNSKRASVTTNFGLTANAGQVERMKHTITENNTELNGAFFTSLACVNCKVEFVGYQFTYTP